MDQNQLYVFCEGVKRRLKLVFMLDALFWLFPQEEVLGQGEVWERALPRSLPLRGPS